MQNAHAIPLPALTDPNRPPPSLSGRVASQRLGRTAAYIHLLAWFAFLAAWILMEMLGQYSPEGQAVQGVGGATALTCAIWSGLLALRAIWHGEPVFVPIVVMLLLAVEATLPCLWLWLPLLEGYNPLTPLYELSLWLGLPLFVPFFVLSTLVIAPVAWLGMRLVERWRRKPDEAPWHRRRRLKAGLTAYLILFVLVMIGFLPYPLFAFSALEQSHTKYWTPPINWQGAALNLTPNYVRSGLDAFCSRNLSWRYVRHRVTLIEKGHLPRECLLAHMEDPLEEIQAAAWRTYFREHTDDAIALSEVSLAPETRETRFDPTWSIWQARRCFRDWSHEQRLRWMGLMLRAMEDREIHIRRAAAHVAQGCISKPDKLNVPWPWNGTATAEQPGERAGIEVVRQAATEWIADQMLNKRP